MISIINQGILDNFLVFEIFNNSKEDVLKKYKRRWKS